MGASLAEQFRNDAITMDPHDVIKDHEIQEQKGCLGVMIKPHLSICNELMTVSWLQSFEFIPDTSIITMSLFIRRLPHTILSLIVHLMSLKERQ